MFDTNTGCWPGGRTHHRRHAANRPISNEGHDLQLPY
jgi:hypothetical protein